MELLATVHWTADAIFLMLPVGYNSDNRLYIPNIRCNSNPNRIKADACYGDAKMDDSKQPRPPPGELAEAA